MDMEHHRHGHGASETWHAVEGLLVMHCGRGMHTDMHAHRRRHGHGCGLIVVSDQCREEIRRERVRYGLTHPIRPRRDVPVRTVYTQSINPSTEFSKGIHQRHPSN